MKNILNFFHRQYHLKYHDIYKQAKKLFFFDIFLLILTLFLFISGIFFFFWKPSIADQVEINFSYSSQKIISGQDLEIIIEYKNNSKFEMNDSVLVLHLPAGFLLDKAKNSQISDTNTINLGQIKAGGNGNLAIIGQIIGNTTEKDKITAILTYKIGSSNKIDQKKEMGLIEYSGAEIKSELSIEKTTFPDKKLPFRIKIANISPAFAKSYGEAQPAVAGSYGEAQEKNIDGINIILPNFAKLNTKLPFSLSPGQEITFNGVFEIQKTIGKVPFSYQITRKQNNRNFTQQKETVQIEVLSPDILLKIIPQTTYAYLESGDNLKVEVVFENLSRNLLQDQILILQDLNQVLDLPATAKKNNIKENGQELIIDDIAKTSNLFTLNLKLKNNAGALASSLNIVPVFSAKLFNSETNFSSTGNEINIPLVSLLQAEISPRYYTVSGDQIGRGPLPPQVGQTTKYWIYADIKNGANNLADFKFTAKTNAKTLFTGKQSVSYGNEIIFNKDEALWQKETISAFTTIGLYFEAEVTPNQNDLGKELELLKEIKIEATDTLTGKKYELELGPVVNKLEEDDVGSKMGNEVVE